MLCNPEFTFTYTLLPYIVCPIQGLHICFIFINVGKIPSIFLLYISHSLNALKGILRKENSLQFNSLEHEVSNIPPFLPPEDFILYSYSTIAPFVPLVYLYIALSGDWSILRMSMC